MVTTTRRWPFRQRPGQTPADTGAPAAALSRRHPLPWRNTPAGGENHVTDAHGSAVYDGPDAAEMFRLLAAATGPRASGAAPAPDRAERATGS
jgi:hypothetical protein